MGIRDILIFAIVAAGIPFMLRSPAIAIMFWVWIGMMNPHKLAFGFAQNFPFAVLVAGLTFASLVISREKLRFKSRPAVLVLFVFCVWTTITTFFALNPEDAWPEWERAMKIQLLTFVALLALNTRRHVEMLVAVLTFSVAFFGVKGGLFTLRTGGESLVYGPGGFLSENNSTALAILMSMPLIWYFYLQTERRWLKVGAGAVARVVRRRSPWQLLARRIPRYRGDCADAGAQELAPARATARPARYRSRCAHIHAREVGRKDAYDRDLRAGRLGDGPDQRLDDGFPARERPRRWAAASKPERRKSSPATPRTQAVQMGGYRPTASISRCWENRDGSASRCSC